MCTVIRLKHMSLPAGPGIAKWSVPRLQRSVMIERKREEDNAKGESSRSRHDKVREVRRSRSPRSGRGSGPQRHTRCGPRLEGSRGCLCRQLGCRIDHRSGNHTRSGRFAQDGIIGGTHCQRRKCLRERIYSVSSGLDSCCLGLV